MAKSKFCIPKKMQSPTVISFNDFANKNFANFIAMTFDRSKKNDYCSLAHCL